MKRWVVFLCMILAAATAVSGLPVLALALESGLEDGTAVISETAPAEYVELSEPAQAAFEETMPAQTAPMEMLPPETAAQETIPVETELQETLPAQEQTDADGASSGGAIIHSIPLYFQNDYPQSRYGHGTVASSGCSVTCLAMVANYLTGFDYMPDELADYFGWKGQNNMQRLEIGSDALQLPYTKNTNWHVTEQALREGKVAIVLMNQNSVFTDGQHFVVITGISEDGKYYVNDPNRNNYDRWELKTGFAEGFDSLTISNGFSGAWVYDKAAMPENLLRYEEEKPEGEPRYPGVSLTLEEEDLLAKVIWVEARGESFEGQQAIAEVVLNRLVSEDFSDTLSGVIYAEGQFRSVPHLDDAEPTHTQYEAIERALSGPNVLPIDVVFFATYPTNDNVWGKIGGHIFCYQY